MLPNKKVLFLIADGTFGLTTLLVNQAISFNKIKSIHFDFISGSNEQEPKLFEKLSENNIVPKIISGINSHSKFKQLVKEYNAIIIDTKPDIIEVIIRVKNMVFFII